MLLGVRALIFDVETLIGMGYRCRILTGGIHVFISISRLIRAQVKWRNRVGLHHVRFESIFQENETLCRKEFF